MCGSAVGPGCGDSTLLSVSVKLDRLGPECSLPKTPVASPSDSETKVASAQQPGGSSQEVTQLTDSAFCLC